MPPEYKRCPVCKIEKPRDAFHLKRVRPDGMSYRCKECTAALGRTPEVRAKNREAGRRRYAKVQAFFLALKSRPCMDCGGTFPPCAMDFDHRDPTKKQINIARYSGGGLSPKLLAELEHCDIICSNCHRIRTAAQRPLKLFQIGRRRKDECPTYEEVSRALDSTR